MKKHVMSFLSMSLISIMGGLYAQDMDTTMAPVNARDTAWKKGALLTLTFGQTYLSDNWAAGGEPSYSLNTRANLFANYELGKVLWQNKVDAAYGYTQLKSSGFNKNDDVIELTSNFGYKATKRWYYSVVISAKSQFDEGVKYTATDTTTISDFLSPLYLNLAPGMNYKHNEYLQVFLSPFNARFIYVNDTSFSGINSLKGGVKWRKEFGFIAKVNYKRSFTPALSVLSNLDVFYDYLDPKAPTVSWEVLINIKIWKSLSINLNTLLIYDENVKEANDTGGFDPVGVQFKEVFGAGLALNF